MGLLQRLLTEGRKDVIINKIGLPEDIANWITNNVHKKFQIWFANYIKDTMDTLFRRRGDDDDRMYKEVIQNGEIAVQYEIIFERGQHVIDTVFRVDEKPKLDIREYTFMSDIRRLVDEYVTIRDWARGVTPSPNLKQMEWEDAYIQAQEWHDSLGTAELSAEITDVAPDAEIIHTFDDGFMWVNLHTNHCPALKPIMGHCASSDADTILQLITADDKYRATLAFSYDGTYRQLKGFQNLKPDRKYYPYIEWLFTNGGKYQVKAYKEEHDPPNDFKVEDLDEDVREDVLEKYPDLEGGTSFARAERLYDDGKIDEALEELNEMIGQHYYNGERAIGFHGGFWNVFVDTEFSDFDIIFDDVIDKVETYSYDTAKAIEKLALGTISELELIDELMTNIDDEDMYSLIDMIYMLTKEEQNNLILNIVREDPSLYKGLQGHTNREMIIDDVITRKIETDNNFSRIYNEELNNVTRYTKEQIDKYVDEERYEEVMFFLKELPDRCGFSIFEEDGDKMLSYVVYMDSYAPEEDIYIASAFSSDRIYGDIQYQIENMDDWGGDDRMYEIQQKLSEFAKNLDSYSSKLSLEEVLFRYMFIKDIPSDAVDMVRKKLIKMGYLDSSITPATDTSQQTKLEI